MNADGNDTELITVSSPEQCTELARVLADVWGLYELSAVASPDTLCAMARSGCYVTGVMVGGKLIGGGFGWPTQVGGEWRLHSHVVGFLDGFRARGLGARIKHHQREFVRSAGLDAVEWTYDPLHGTNARFNLAKLGAQVLSFHHDYYGTLEDAFSKGLGSDRFLVRWGLDDDPPVAAADIDQGEPILEVGSDGSPVVRASAAKYVTAAVPANIVSIRSRDTALALEWRDAFAATVGREVTNGARVTGIGTDLIYRLER